MLLLLQLPEALITDALGLFVIGHNSGLAGAVGAEDLTAVAAVVLPICEGKRRFAAQTAGHVGIVGPFATRLFHQFYL